MRCLLFMYIFLYQGLNRLRDLWIKEEKRETQMVKKVSVETQYINYKIFKWVKVKSMYWVCILILVSQDIS